MSDNSFESGQRKVIPAVLIYAKWDQKILMIHRNSKERPTDHHLGKWNGLGGKLDADESPRQAAAREFFEESGVQLPTDRFQGLGSLLFPNFKAKKSEDWWVSVFQVKLSDGEARLIKPKNPEGTLHWVSSDSILELNLWAGDRHFIPFVISEKLFQGTLWYEGEKVRQVEVYPLS